MNRISIFTITALLSLGVIVGCSVLKGNDAEVNVKNFLSRFAADIQRSDSISAEHFKTDHSEWALRAALRVLNNKMESPVTTAAMFTQATITISDSIFVRVPVSFSADSAGTKTERLTNLEMTLVQMDTTFKITRWNGESFYEEFWAYSNAIEAGQTALHIEESRGQLFARALELQQQFDSVIWVSGIGTTKNYYYVVSGQWEQPYSEKPLPVWQYQMGLVDETGKEIVPVAFDLIGMPGDDDRIEVRKNNLYGLYQLSTGKELLPSEYAWIVPYNQDGTNVLVKKDTLLGWIDEQWAFHAGLPNKEAEEYIRQFKFLPDEIKLNKDDATFLEIPSERQAGKGVLIPDSYYTYFGIFDEIENDFVMEIFNEEAGVEYKEARLSFFEKITGAFSALISDARDAYVYSREGFYDHQKVTFINSKGEFITTHDLREKGKLAFRMIDDTHLEVKISPSEEVTGDYMEPAEGEINTPQYVYFAADGDQALIPLETNRWHACTAFAKLDSSYVTGNFTVYDEEGTSTEATFLSTATLTSMRNEILADYGYIFQNPDVLENFKYRDWYKPQYASVADFEEELSEIDRHNLNFLEKILGPVDTSTTAM